MDEKLKNIGTEQLLADADDEQLVTGFFKENTPELLDNGFSERVMRRLPDDRVWLNRIWTFVCVLAVVALFFWMRGFAALRGLVVGWLADLGTHVLYQPINIVAIYGSLIVLLLVAGMSLSTRER